VFQKCGNLQAKKLGAEISAVSGIYSLERYVFKDYNHIRF